MKMLRALIGLPAVALAFAVVACAAAAPGPADVPPFTMQVRRLIVSSLTDWPTPAAFADRAAAVAGVPVRDVSVVAPRQFALSLICADATICTAALRRLAAERDLVLDVQVDQRRRLPARPVPASSP